MFIPQSRLLRISLMLALLIIHILAVKRVDQSWKLDRVECKSDFCDPYFCELKRKSRTVQVLNGACTLKQPLHRAIVHIKLFYRFRRYQPMMMDYEVDVCDAVGNQTSTNAVIKYFLPYLLRYSNANHSCPYVGEIAVRDLKYESAMLVGIPFPLGQYRVDFRVYDPTTNDTFFEESSYLTHSSSYETNEFSLG